MPGPGGPGGGPGGGFGGPGGGMGGFGGPGMGGGSHRPPGGGMMGGSPRPTGGGFHMGGGSGCAGTMGTVLIVVFVIIAFLGVGMQALFQSPAFFLIVVAAIIAVIGLFIYKMYDRHKDAEAEDAKATERILNTPLEKYGDEADEELEDLESKYAQAAGVDSGKKAKRGSGPNVAFCPECGAKVLTSTQAFCASCGSELPTTGSAKGTAGAQSPDSSTN